MFTKEQWAAIWDAAGALQAANTAPSADPWNIRGRFIVPLVNRLCQFWEDHRDTLVPFLSQLAIAALEALITARQNINNVNPPGPH